MDSQSELLLRTLQNRLAQAGLDWVQLSHTTYELVVFGSRAAGVNRRQSDLDVLLVGSKARVKRAGLDLVGMSRAEIESAEWLGSELASHVANYGLWIIGSGKWREGVRISLNAADRKERHLLSLARSVDRSWSELHPAFQLKYRTTVRRELQRLLLLRSAIPIPPTPILDWDWQADKISRDALLSIAASQGGLQGRLDCIHRILSASTEGNAKKQAKIVRPSRFLSSANPWLVRTRELLAAQR